jgi:hypothetical protein
MITPGGPGPLIRRGPGFLALERVQRVGDRDRPWLGHHDAGANGEGEQIPQRDRAFRRDGLFQRPARTGEHGHVRQFRENSSTGSSRRSVQSSTSVMAQAATIGLVIEPVRQIVSAAIGVLEPAPSNARVPVASMWTSPWRATTATAPGT